jgi:hypothetical protein
MYAEHPLSLAVTGLKQDHQQSHLHIVQSHRGREQMDAWQVEEAASLSNMSFHGVS